MKVLRHRKHPTGGFTGHRVCESQWVALSARLDNSAAVTSASCRSVRSCPGRMHVRLNTFGMPYDPVPCGRAETLLATGHSSSDAGGVVLASARTNHAVCLVSKVFRDLPARFIVLGSPGHRRLGAVLGGRDSTGGARHRTPGWSCHRSRAAARYLGSGGEDDAPKRIMARGWCERRRVSRRGRTGRQGRPLLCRLERLVGHTEMAMRGPVQLEMMSMSASMLEAAACGAMGVRGNEACVFLVKRPRSRRSGWWACLHVCLCKHNRL